MRPLVISPSKLKVLYSPTEFYNCIISMIRNAKQRLYLSSLYIGTGEIEQKVIKEIEINKKINRTLQCALFFDKGRSERREKGISSLDILKTLTHYPNTTISLYQNPKIDKPHFSMLPSIIKELIGVYHTKIVISDNDILITGANVNQTYFLNRTDRYYLLKDCKQLSDHLFDYFNAIKTLAYELKPNGKCYLKKSRHCSFKKLEKYAIEYAHIPVNHIPKDEILLFLSNQLKCEKVDIDERNLKEILKNKSEFSKMIIHSGYCNLSDRLISEIGNLRTDIYTSSPKANSFDKGGIVKGRIPYLYRVYEKKLLNLSNKQITLYEYSKPNWTFHNKGIWLYSKQGLPVITGIGSSNYNNRAFNRDFETQFYLLSNNPSFSSQLTKETKSIVKDCSKITLDDINKDKNIQLKEYHYIFAKIMRNHL